MRINTKFSAKPGIVRSSHGEITISLMDGRILSIDEDEGSELSDIGIVKFDIDEYAQHYGSLDDEFDILDLGYWTGDGKYEPPDEAFRAQISVKERR